LKKKNLYEKTLVESTICNSKAITTQLSLPLCKTFCSKDVDNNMIIILIIMKKRYTPSSSSHFLIMNIIFKLQLIDTTYYNTANLTSKYIKKEPHSNFKVTDDLFVVIPQIAKI